MAGNTGTPGAGVVGRVFTLLGVFDAEHPRLSLTAIARRSGLPLSTTHRLVAELVEEGALDTTGRDYTIGRRLWDIGLLAPVYGPLRQAASPFLHDLYAATGATTHLAVRDRDAALCLERLAGRTSAPVIGAIGSSLPLHATGVGKVMLAHAPAGVWQRVSARLWPLTSHTVTDPWALSDELSRVRREGFATTSQEMTEGTSAVAVPVRQAGRVVAALGFVVSDPSERTGRLVTMLQAAARGISRSL